MPIATYKPITPVVDPDFPTIEPTQYKSIVVDDQNISILSLMAYVDGSPLSTIYYQQLLAKHNELKDYDLGQQNVYQQYKRIEGLEIRITDPITSSQDTTEGTMTVTGGGNIYPFITPNVGDVFIASLADNSKALFRVTEVERKSFLKESVFHINFTLNYFLDTNPAIIEDLEAKSQYFYYYNKDRLLEGKNPVLIGEQAEVYDIYKKALLDIVRYYFSQFFNPRLKTFVLPDQDYVIYDSYLVNHLRKILTVIDHPLVGEMKLYNTEKESYLSEPTLWTAILEQDSSLLQYCNRDMGFAGANSFSNDPYLDTIRYNQIHYVVYPRSGTFTQTTPKLTRKPTIDLVLKPPTFSGVLNTILDDYTQGMLSIPFIRVATINDNYIFSSAFYSQNNGLSLLETMTLAYLNKQPIASFKLTETIKRYLGWSKMEQFYYLPILLTLIKYELARE